ncbi:hypothetical protein ACTJJ0_06505 [Chitinophaga sp. 22321]|uniref:Lipocalin-like domain-containing protein n=1 Tax=Chitinophaga hostae TaxID=2831022 RepID=A0ABS5IYR1_9BACT|nr:hypothetical protein [Chitinophaga hostae]MBS0028089.1 hypothetical protein [Chitinophaga hostae]
MLTIFKTLLIACCVFLCCGTQAQNLQGVWKGYTAIDYDGWAQMDGTYILQIIKTDNGQYTGTAWFHENDQLFGELSVTGERKEEQQNWIFKEIKVNSITIPKTYHTSLAELTLRWFNIDGEIVLQGSIVSYSTYNNKKVHARRFIRLSKLSDQEITALRIPGSGKKIEPQPADTPVINITKNLNTPPAVPGTSQHKPMVTDSIALSSRKNRVQGSYEISSPAIEISLYDYGTIDHDTVTVFFNGNKVADRQELSAKPLRIQLSADPGIEYQELVLHANNLGDIPPNTAKMIILTSDKRYELRVSSSETENAMIRFRYTPATNKR